MVPMTDASSNSPKPVAEFYDWLAADYDRMTGFEKRFVQERPFFRLLVHRHEIRTAVDAGSGTGFHSLLLAQLGVNVTAVDVSGEMLSRLEQHAKALNVSVRVLQASFAELPGRVSPPVDAVFCLGNTLPHLLTSDALEKALRSFAAVLRPGGVIFLQILNFDRILRSRERVQSVKESDGEVFVRFYDYEEKLIRFNVLRLRKERESFRHELNSVVLRPLLARDVTETLARTGISGIRTFGGITLEPFAPDGSRDLVVIGSKGEKETT
jgi:glycine/sarcosine N-methyltransferase